MTITYYGHSVLQIETNGTTLLFDPFIDGNKHTEGVVEIGDLTPDVIVLTHAHFDHWGDTPAIVEACAPLVVGQLEVVNYVKEHLGHEDVHPMNTGGAWDFDWGRLTQTYARHSSSFPDGTYGGLASGYLLQAENTCIYNAGDTCLFDEMARIGQQHAIDLAFLPIGDDFTMGIDEAVEAAKLLRPGRVVPVHYDTFPLIEADVDAWASKMKDAGLDTLVLQPGDQVQFADEDGGDV